MGKWAGLTKCINGKQYFISRLVMESLINRKLTKDDLVHHKNENPRDNRKKNLELTTRSGHKKIHGKIGEKTRFKPKYNFDKKTIYNLYLKHKDTAAVAKLFGCNEVTIRRIVRLVSGYKTLRELARERRWKYAWR